MQDWAKQFISRLHRDSLRPLGFRKQRHTFSRERESHTERVQIQGSSWNDPDGLRWTFYLNAGLYFPELPEPIGNRGFVHTHVYARLRQFDARCKDAFELTEANESETQQAVTSSIVTACNAFERDIVELKRFAATARFAWAGTRR